MISHVHSHAGGLEGPPISGALAARQRREAGALQVAGDANRRAELLERRQNALNRYFYQFILPPSFFLKFSCSNIYHFCRAQQVPHTC